MPRLRSVRLSHMGLMGAVGVGLVVWGLWIGLRPLSDNSFLTHLATGRLIADGDIPRHDVFTFTAAGESWVVQSWLVSGLYGLVDEAFGGHGLLFLQGALTTLLAVLVLRLARPATSVTARLAVAALGVGVGAGMWTERPLLVGLLLFGVTLLVAEGSLPAPVLVPAMWVWVNGHGSFPLGVVLLVALAVGRRLDGERPGPEWRALPWALGGVLLGAVGPLGVSILEFPVELLSRSDVLRNIEEWQAPEFRSTTERLFLAQVVLAVLALVRCPSYRNAIASVVFVAAALVATRNIAVASLVLVVVTAHGLRGLGTIAGDRRAPVFSFAALALLGLGALIAADAAEDPPFALAPYPREALAWMGGATALERTPTATPDFVGNYLEAALGPRRVVFVDDRYDMFPDEVVGDYLSLLRAGGSWEEVLDANGIGAIVWEQRSPLATVLRESPRWRIAFGDARWLVALPREPRSR